jgi:hypothetical protein
LDDKYEFLLLPDDSGFGPAQRFFSSLFWGAWVTSRRAD